jgi:hypothetical protein
MRKVLVLTMAVLTTLLGQATTPATPAIPATTSIPQAVQAPFPLSSDARSEIQAMLLEMALMSSDVRELQARLEGATRGLREIQERLGREIAKAKVVSGIKPGDEGKWTVNARGVWVTANVPPPSPSSLK